MAHASELAQPIKDKVNEFVLDKKIPRPLLIEILEDAASDIEGLLASLHDDERRSKRA